MPASSCESPFFVKGSSFFSESTESFSLGCFTCPSEGDAWAGLWEFPGGKIEAHEGPESALIRELFEEIGVSTKPTRRIEQTRYEDPDRSVKLQLWDCGVVDPDSIRLIEHDEARWLSVEELLEVKWLPADLPIVERWRREGIPRA